MKSITLEPVATIEGKPFRLAKWDEEGNPVIRKNELGGMSVENTPSTDLVEILTDFVLHQQPREKFTRLDAVRVGNVYCSLKEANGILNLDESEHDWLIKKLEDENIGVKRFGHDVTVIIDAVNRFKRVDESKK